MAATIITTKDLFEFNVELLEDIKKLLESNSNYNTKKWMKSQDVRDFLAMSPSTLQNLRINGALPYTKVVGVIYYDYQEITKVLEENRIHNKF